MTDDTMTGIQKAIRLALDRGWYVFPVGKDKRPLDAGGHGHLDASNDPETIATAFGQYPDALVGVHVGRSGILVLDVDLHEDNKNGFESIELAFWGILDTLNYETPTGGKHYIYRAPTSLVLPPRHGYRDLAGVDRKSGSSYIVYWGALSDDEITEPPDWLLDTVEARTGDAYEGELDEWLDALGDEEPGERVLRAIQRIPDEPFSHPEMVERQFEFIRLAAEGAPGARVGLDMLRSAWLREPWNTDDYAYEYDAALASGIKKFGALEAKIAGLPRYADCIGRLGASGIELVVGEARPKGHYFRLINYLVNQPQLTSDEIASIVWSAPTTTAIARDWGIDYLFANIGSARIKASAPVENPSLGTGPDENKSYDLTLLTEEERTAVEISHTFVDSYMEWAESKVNVVNAPYHRQNALTLLSVSYGCRVFIPLKARPMGVNLFQLGLGESSTGKSESINLRDQIIRSIFTRDPTYDMGSNPSPEALHEALITRDHQPSLFNTDEAAAPLTEFLTKSYAAGITDRLTSYYEGYVAPMLRRGQAGAATSKAAVASFNIAMFGTPEKVLDILTRDQFESGFLARFLWQISADVVADDTQYEESEATERVVATQDPIAEAFADTLGRRGDVGTNGIPILCEPDALRRMSENRKRMAEALKDHEQWGILQPSVRRLGDNLRKIATLIAVSDGSDRVYLHHALGAIGLGEELIVNLEQVARRVSASIFEKFCDQIETFLVSQGGGCAASRVFHTFRKYELKDTQNGIEALIMQGRIKQFDPTASRGARLELNYDRLMEEEA